MSFEVVRRLACDATTTQWGPEMLCGRKFNIEPGETVAQARKRAADKGWVRGRNVDVCPACSRNA